MGATSGQGQALSRRALLGAAAGLALSGCGAARAQRSPTAGATAAPATVPPAGGPPSSAQWQVLAASLTGSLVLPDAPAYPVSVQLYDPRFDTVRPQAVAYCATPDDAARVVAFARTHAVPLALRSGGHSYGGYSTGPGVVLDVSRMSGVLVDTAAGTATVGAGTRLIDLYTAANAAGVSVPAGSCPTVGIAGLALGGGSGVVGRAHGLTCDRLRAVRVVTADSRTVTADATEASDLLWASRGGGGGSFAVVTELVFDTFPVVPVTVFTLHWPWAAADQVIPAHLAWAPSGPDELWANCVVATDPTSPSATVEVNGVWLGPPATLAPLLSELHRVAGSTPSTTVDVPATFAHAMLVEAGCAGSTPAACRLPSQGPRGALARRPSLARSDYLTSPLGDAGVAALLAGIDRRRSEGLQGAFGIDSYGGAINRVAPDATAFAHRDTIASLQYNADIAPGAAASVVEGDQVWLDGWYASMRPHVSGQAYQNYIDPELGDWQAAYYGANLPRLEQVKATWDPDDAFSFAQSIPLPTR